MFVTDQLLRVLESTPNMVAEKALEKGSICAIQRFFPGSVLSDTL